MGQVYCRVQEPIQILWLSWIVSVASRINYPLRTDSSPVKPPDKNASQPTSQLQACEI